MCTEFNLKIDESTELLDTKTFDDYDTNELLLLSDTIKQSCFEFLFNLHSILILSADSPIFNNLIANIYFSKVHDIIRVGKNHKIVPR